MSTEKALSAPVESIVIWRFVRGPYCNIQFDGTWPMCGGKFPKSHPCHDDPKPTVMGKYRRKKPGSDEWQDMPGEQPESETALGLFRSRGYWASCFPEGDGITFEPLRDQSDDQVVADIAECFGVEVAR